MSLDFKQFRDQIFATADIYQVVSESVELRRIAERYGIPVPARHRAQ